MSTKAIIGIVGAITVVCLILIFVINSISYKNDEIELRNLANAQQEKCSAYYDKLWKIISQKAQVADKYKDSFSEIYVQLIEGRYSSEQGGSLMRFIQESNPNFDASLFKDLSQTIEGQREGFFIEQARLIDIDREHKNLRLKFPGSFFLSSTKDLNIKIITSSVTKDVIKSGEENNIKVFGK